MNTTNQPTVHRLESGKAIILRKGLRVEPASNLPDHSSIKFWITEIPSKMLRDPEIESNFRNIGFGVTASQVS